MMDSSGLQSAAAAPILILTTRAAATASRHHHDVYHHLLHHQKRPVYVLRGGGGGHHYHHHHCHHHEAMLKEQVEDEDDTRQEQSTHSGSSQCAASTTVMDAAAVARAASELYAQWFDQAIALGAATSMDTTDGRGTAVAAAEQDPALATAIALNALGLGNLILPNSAPPPLPCTLAPPIILHRPTVILRTSSTAESTSSSSHPPPPSAPGPSVKRSVSSLSALARPIRVGHAPPTFSSHGVGSGRTTPGSGSTLSLGTSPATTTTTTSDLDDVMAVHFRRSLSTRIHRRMSDRVPNGAGSPRASPFPVRPPRYNNNGSPMTSASTPIHSSIVVNLQGNLIDEHFRRSLGGNNNTTTTTTTSTSPQ